MPKQRSRLMIEIALLEMVIAAADFVEAFQSWLWDRPPVHVLAVSLSIISINAAVIASRLYGLQDPGFPIAMSTALWACIGYHALVRERRRRLALPVT